MKPCLIHLEHALPVLPELGIETLVPFFGGQGFSTENVVAALNGLSSAASKRAARRLVAIARATGAELLAWEADGAAQERAEKDAAVVPFDEAVALVKGFFSSLGVFQFSTQASSEPLGEGLPAPPETASALAP